MKPLQVHNSRLHSWRNRGGGGGPRGTFPPVPPIPFPWGTRGTRYIMKMGLFYLSWTVFSHFHNCIGGYQIYNETGPFFTSLELFFSNFHNCIGGFKPFETPGIPPPPPPTYRIISPALAESYPVTNNLFESFHYFIGDILLNYLSINCIYHRKNLRHFKSWRW